GARRLTAGPGNAVDQRVADILTSETEVAEEPLLERQDHREPIDGGGEAPCAAGVPGPELRGNVVEHLGSRLASGFLDAKVEAWVVDQNDEIVATGAKIVPERMQQAKVGAQLRDHLHEAEGRQTFDGIANHRPRFGHSRSPERFDCRIGMTSTQRAHDASAMKVPRRLAGGNEDSRGWTGDHPTGMVASGDIRTASATRSASARAARPSSPRTTTSRPPRTACTKLCSSRPSASASGASS